MKIKVTFEEEIEMSDLPDEFFIEATQEIIANLHSDGEISMWIGDHVPDKPASINIKELVSIVLDHCVADELRNVFTECITLIDNNN